MISFVVVPAAVDVMLCVCVCVWGWVQGTNADCIMSFSTLIFNCVVVWNDIIKYYIIIKNYN